MERWENRYTRSASGAGSQVEHTRIDRVKNLLIILLAVALAATGIVCAKAVDFRSRTDENMASRIKSEVNSAVSLASNLSRSNGSETPAVLARIRANVHTAETINEMSYDLNGGNWVEAVIFTNIYSIIDSYFAKLNTGTSTIQEQTDLALQLSNIQTLLKDVK